MKVYLDAEHPTSAGWVRVYCPDEVIRLLVTATQASFAIAGTVSFRRPLRSDTGSWNSRGRPAATSRPGPDGLIFPIVWVASGA
ncbi:hypothetical protein BCAR13_1560024 [Paraburkholderia caribensis]|nr:hypothetical protein BCAR13_1560024 [Paraburkholderia caribensis]